MMSDTQTVTTLLTLNSVPYPGYNTENEGVIYVQNIAKTFLTYTKIKYVNNLQEQ